MTGSWTRRAGEHLVERRLGVGSAGRRGRERHVVVERRVLVARRGLDRGDDLARDAQLREVAERRLAVGAVVADRLVEADEALLDQVVASRRRPGSTTTPSGARTSSSAARGGRTRPRCPASRARSGTHHQPELELESVGESLATSTSLPGPCRARIGRGAHLPWRPLTVSLRPIANPQAQRDMRRELHAYVDASSRGLQDLVQRAPPPAALTLSDSMRPRSGSATRSSQAAATRGPQPLPLGAEHEHDAAASSRAGGSAVRAPAAAP